MIMKIDTKNNSSKFSNNKNEITQILCNIKHYFMKNTKIYVDKNLCYRKEKKMSFIKSTSFEYIKND